MKITSKFTIPAAAMFAIALGAAPLAAQTPAPAGQTPAPAGQSSASASSQEQKKTASGELVRVDADKKMVAIEGADGKEVTFKYDDDTEISGAAQNIEGLATKTGTRVTVEYSGEGAAAVASRIAIQAASPASPSSPSSSSPSPSPSPAPSSPAPAPAPAPRPGQ